VYAGGSWDVVEKSCPANSGAGKEPKAGLWSKRMEGGGIAAAPASADKRAPRDLIAALLDRRGRERAPGKEGGAIAAVRGEQALSALRLLAVRLKGREEGKVNRERGRGPKREKKNGVVF